MHLASLQRPRRRVVVRMLVACQSDGSRAVGVDVLRGRRRPAATRADRPRQPALHAQLNSSGIASGSSKEPIDIAMCWLCAYRKKSGVPQLPQKPRSTCSELLKTPGAPRVQDKSPSGTPTRAEKKARRLLAHPAMTDVRVILERASLIAHRTALTAPRQPVSRHDLASMLRPRRGVVVGMLMIGGGDLLRELGIIGLRGLVAGKSSELCEPGKPSLDPVLLLRLDLLRLVERADRDSDARRVRRRGW